MDLERLSVRLRPRKPWEAVDLGFTMVRSWRGAVFGPWLLLTVPVALTLIWTLHFWGYVLFWWLLPLFEAVVLWPLSRAVFGEVPTVRQTLRAAPGEMRKAWREVLLRRLHPARSFALPIGQLEGLTGSDRRARRAVLGQAIDVHTGMTLVFVLLQLLLITALVTLVVLLTPSWIAVEWEVAFDHFFEGVSAGWVYDLAWTACALVLLAVDPFYVAGGFALYLDRRTALEGWDLEIAFRRMARRLRELETGRTRDDARRRGGRAASWPGWFLVLGGLWTLALAGPAPTAWSQPEDAATENSAQPEDAATENRSQPEDAAPENSAQPEDAAPENSAQPEDAAPEPAAVNEEPAPPPEPAVWDGPAEDDPRALAQDIVSQPEFGGTETVTRWRLRDDIARWLEDDEPKAAKPASRPSPLLLALARFLVWISEAALWLVLGVAAVALVILAMRRWPDARGERGAGRAEVPETVLGLDLRAESLPADVAGAAERLWRGGDPAAALSLLYRGALHRLVDDGVRLSESFTEDDCLRAARAVCEPVRTGFFAELTGAWLRAAYGHEPPTDGDRWVDGWRRHFGRRAGAS